MDSGQLSSCLSRPMQDAGSHGANKSEEVRVTLAEKFTALQSPRRVRGASIFVSVSPEKTPEQAVTSHMWLPNI